MGVELRNKANLPRETHVPRPPNTRMAGQDAWGRRLARAAVLLRATLRFFLAGPIIFASFAGYEGLSVTSSAISGSKRVL